MNAATKANEAVAPGTHPPSAYKHIKAWHQSSGSMSYYWANLQEKASEAGAPIDVIYLNQKKEWVPITNAAPDVQERINALVAKMVY